MSAESWELSEELFEVCKRSDVPPIDQLASAVTLVTFIAQALGISTTELVEFLNATYEEARSHGLLDEGRGVS